MKAVAREMNLSETAFLHPLAAGGEADYALRWFTPAVEVALCGHATLASAHVLGRPGTVRFATRSGVPYNVGITSSPRAPAPVRRASRSRRQA